MTPLHHVLNQFNLRNHVTSPTRVTSSTATLLDLFLSTTPIQGVCETIHLDISDHFAILARLPISASHHLQGQHQRKTRCLHKVDWNMFTCDLEKTLTTCDSVCVDMLASSLTAGIQTTLDKHAPLRERRRKSRRPCPWITDELVASGTEPGASSLAPRQNRSEPSRSTPISSLQSTEVGQESAQLVLH